MINKIYPRTGDTQTVYLNAVVKDPSIKVGDYTIYNDFVSDPRLFEQNNVLYHYPINHERLIIGKFCSIACGEAGKDEQVPDVFQPFGNHSLFEDDFYLVLRQVAPIHFLQPDFITGERVIYQYAVVTGYDDDALEELHELGGSVVTALAGCTQVQLKIGNEHRRYLLNGYVRYIVLALNELGKVAAGDFILAVSRYRLGYADQLLHIVIVLLEQ